MYTVSGLLLLLFSWLNPGPAPAHQFHISRCMIEYNSAEQALQVTMHLFIDDFEDALRASGVEDKLYLCTEREVPSAEQHIDSYLQKHFALEVDGKKVAYNFLGKEISDDLIAMWCYLEFKEVAPFSEIEISNNVLMELFEDQKNIIHVVGPKRKQGTMLFQKGRSSEKVTF